MCEEKPCILTSSDTFLENGLSPRGVSASFILWYAKPLAIFQFGGRESTMDWESEDSELAATVSPNGCTTLVESPVFSKLHFSSGLPASKWSECSSLGSVDVMYCGWDGVFAPRSLWEALGALPLDLCLLASCSQP